MIPPPIQVDNKASIPVNVVRPCSPEKVARKVDRLKPSLDFNSPYDENKPPELCLLLVVKFEFDSPSGAILRSSINWPIDCFIYCSPS